MCYIYLRKNIKFKVNHGDIAYATTDGYPDQFGGEKQKRFYEKRCKAPPI